MRDVNFLGGEVRLPEWLMKMNLSSGAKLTYSVLSVCSGGRGLAWPRQEYLAERVSASVRSVQRYLGELARRGLIAIARESHQGKNRCVYSFLNSGQGDNLSPQDVASRPSDTTKCRIQGDNLSCSYKDEDIKLKENTSPLTPQAPLLEPEPPVQAGAAGEGVSLVKAIEEKAPEEPDSWSQVKATLRAELPESEFRIWLEPLHCELRSGQAVLRVPNAFFLACIQKNHAGLLANAFQGLGLELVLEEMTPEEKGIWRRALPAPGVMSPLPSSSPPPEEKPVDWAGLSPEEQFERIYAAYPRQEGYWQGWREFRRLARRGECQPGRLVKAIAGQKNTDGWQREEGRFVPRIARWLAEKRWLDISGAAV